MYPPVIPIPVPIYMPVPMHMFTTPFPIPVPFPLTVPVPIFIPTTQKTFKGLVGRMKVGIHFFFVYFILIQIK